MVHPEKGAAGRRDQRPPGPNPYNNPASQEERSEGPATDATEVTSSTLQVQRGAFRPVPNFLGMYEVACDGRVRSVDRAVRCRDGRVKQLRGVELAISEGRVSLSVLGQRHTLLISRLLREVFGGES